jgi:hypothetical protein
VSQEESREKPASGASPPDAPPQKNSKCSICDYLAAKTEFSSNKTKAEFQSSGVSTLYNILRSEMIDSFNRMSNARNWALGLLLATLGGIASFMSGKGPLNELSPTVLAVGITIISFFTLQLSLFVENAQYDAINISSYLMAIESYYNLHTWNEHFSWKSREKDKFALILIDSIWRDFYFWLSCIYTYIIAYLYLQMECNFIIQICFGICFIIIELIVVNIYKCEKIYKNRLINSVKILTWMNSSDAQ